MWVDLGLAFTAGLFGTTHCLGMCSGIAGGFCARAGRCGRSFLLHYHTARILTYILLGAGGAALGGVLVQTGMVGKAQGILLIATGAVVCLFGLSMVWHQSGAKASRPERPQLFQPRAPWRIATLGGLLNGLVPCSLVFSVALKAAATASLLQASLLMLTFGLGTLPGMVGVGILAGAGSNIPRLRLLTGLTVVALGVWTLYEGWVFFEVMKGLAN